MLVGIAGLAILGSYLAATHEPQFYREALKTEPAQQAELGAQLEQAVLDMRNDALRGGRWQAVFTDEQLNGWLAADLPEKFPNLLPAGVEEPRIVIEQNEAHIACRYDNGQISTVISFALAINLTDEPNTLAVQVSKLRAGGCPFRCASFSIRLPRRRKTAKCRCAGAKPTVTPWRGDYSSETRRLRRGRDPNRFD